MALLVPDVGEVAMLNSILSKADAVLDPLLLKLFSNNRTPLIGDDAGDYNEVSGGGYADVELDSADWLVSEGTPSVAVYSDFVNFPFTGVPSAPSTVYGYYIVDSNNVLLIVERFPDDDVPFEPVNGSLIKVKPRLTMKSPAT